MCLYPKIFKNILSLRALTVHTGWNKGDSFNKMSSGKGVLSEDYQVRYSPALQTYTSPLKCNDEEGST